jgi:glycine/D-amino acid oxidase-like deaminating enzyme
VARVAQFASCARTCVMRAAIVVATTANRRVRAGKSVWQRTRMPTLAMSPLRRDRTTGVLVVGAGISGAMVAESLADAGLRVTVVDKAAPIAGATSASTALLQYDLDVPLHQLTRRIGADNARRIWHRSYLALGALRQRTRQLRIGAQMEERDSLYLQGNRLDGPGLEEEARARRNAGFQVQFLSQRQVAARYGIARRCGLLGFGNQSAEPRRLAAGFLRAALDRGATLHPHARVVAVEPGKRWVLAQLEHGPVVKARHLVFATGYDIPKHVPVRRHSIASTWVIATRPQAGWPSKCLIWEAADPYLYMRLTPEGRVICGGEDEDFRDEAHRDALLPQKIVALQRKLGRLMPTLDVRAQYAWAGSFGASPTGAPTIGAVPRMPGCYAVLGYGGNGITFSMLAAQLLRGLISGEGDADEDLFSFHRKF